MLCNICFPQVVHLGKTEKKTKGKEGIVHRTKIIGHILWSDTLKLNIWFFYVYKLHFVEVANSEGHPPFFIAMGRLEGGGDDDDVIC